MISGDGGRPRAGPGRIHSARQAAKILTAAGLTTLPQAVDAPLTGTLIRVLSGSVKRHAVARIERRMRDCLGEPPPGCTWRSVAERNALVQAHGYWARARAIHRRGWRADFEFVGVEHLQRAIDRGSGAILWRMDFCGSQIAKQALHGMGIPLVHVSRHDHGAGGDDPIGRRVVGPLYRRAEVRYLADRIEIDPSGDLDYLRALVERAKDNAVISMMGEFPGRAPITAKVCGTDMAFATGAPSLARHALAELLTLYTVWLDYDRYRIVIEDPIPVTGGRAIATRTAVETFAFRLQRAIRAHPESWMRWGRVA